MLHLPTFYRNYPSCHDVIHGSCRRYHGTDRQRCAESFPRGSMFRTRRIADALARRSEVQEVTLEPDGTTMVIREPRVRSLQVLRCLRGPTMQPIKSLFFNERSLTAMMHRDAICIADACTTVHNNNNTLLSDALWHAYGDVLPAACFNERRSERFISYGAIAIGDQRCRIESQWRPRCTDSERNSDRGALVGTQLRPRRCWVHVAYVLTNSTPIDLIIERSDRYADQHSSDRTIGLIAMPINRIDTTCTISGAPRCK